MATHDDGRESSDEKPLPDGELIRPSNTADPLSPPESDDAASFVEEDPPDDPAQDLDDADPLAPMKPAWPVEDE